MLSAHVNAALVQAQRGISVGSTLGTCHKVEAFLGEGSYGLVWRCRHTTTESREAVKVNKNRPETLRREIDILRRLRRLDPDTCSIVRWNSYFFHKELICLSFELLDQSLYHYMKDRSFVGLPVTELKPILHQLASALFHLSSLGIVHADLKPENVMVADRRQRPLKVKLMGFGLGFHVSAAPLGACVQTIGYRAPEVILHAPLDEAIDMWSLGLMVVELASGCRLYPGESEHDVLRFIVEAQGQPADYILDRGHRTECYFHYEERGHRHWNFKSLEQFQHKMGRYSQDTRESDCSYIFI